MGSSPLFSVKGYLPVKNSFGRFHVSAWIVDIVYSNAAIFRAVHILFSLGKLFLKCPHRKIEMDLW